MKIDLPELFRKALKDEQKVLRPYFFPDKETQPQELVTEEVYLRLRLARMFLKHRRVLFQTKYPVVNSLMRFAGLDGKVEVNFLAKPELAGENDETKLDDIVTLDQTLLGPVLYRGGDLELMLGLYAAPADDWAKRFISLAEGISQLTLNATLTTAISIASTIKSSIIDSMSGDGLDLKLGLDKELKENEWLAPGYVVMIAAPENEINEGDLLVKDGELETKRGDVYAAHDYIVLAIEITSQRSDWQSLGYGQIWQDLLKTAAEADDIQVVKDSYTTFTGAIMASRDLSWADRSGIATLAQRRIKAIRDARAPTDFFEGLKGVDELAAAEMAMEALINEDASEIPRVGSEMTGKELLRTDWIE
jgi:hypothetical protein